jgi:hypothetical protein
MRVLNWPTNGLPGLLAEIITLAANPGLALDIEAWEA